MTNMTVADRLIHACEQLPGFYGYRPSAKGHEIQIDEIQFRLPDAENECEYYLRIYLKAHACVGADIDAHYSDRSIAHIAEDEAGFEDIVAHKNKLMAALNQYI